MHCGGGTKPLVALTFDDGPGPYTAQTIKILRRADAHATFFVVGKELGAVAGWSVLPGRELKVGTVGNHTWNHVYLPGLSTSDIQYEIQSTKQAVEALIGGGLMLFRPPYGSHDSRVDEAVSAEGMVQVLWSVNSNDSVQGTTAPEVLQNVLTDVRPGSIVLMHENRGTTLEILPRLLEELKALGYETVTVPELLALDPPTDEQVRSGSCGSPAPVVTATP